MDTRKLKAFVKRNTIEVVVALVLFFGLIGMAFGQEPEEDMNGVHEVYVVIELPDGKEIERLFNQVPNRIHLLGCKMPDWSLMICFHIDKITKQMGQKSFVVNSEGV